MKTLSILAAALLLAGAASARTQELVVGSQGDPSLDPHYMYIGTNVAFWRHIYGSLTMHDEEGRIGPSLAESYKLVDDHTWEFRLRDDVKFEDGSTLSAEDVVYSLNRVKSLPGNPSPYTVRLESITKFEAVGPSTVRITTDAPNPYVPDNLSQVAIVPQKATDGKSTGDFTSEAGIGEYGPYRVSSFSPGDRLVLERNEDYWGEKPHWKRVTFRIMPNDASRVAALLAKDVDLIDFVPPSDVKRLLETPDVAVHDGPSTRMIVLQLNFRDGKVGALTDASGRPLEQNPLKDLRVRQAISKAVDRKAIVERIMNGAADVATQVAMPGMEGYDSDLTMEAADPNGARVLLAEAGYPEGFGISIACSNNRYPNDARVCQAVGQMLARAGLQPKVETQPMSVLLKAMQGGDFGLAMLGMGAQGTRPQTLGHIVHSVDRDAGYGGYNFGGYVNPALDKNIADAVVTLDGDQRDQLMREAVKRTAEEVVVLPLYFQRVLTASRADLTYTTDPTEETLTWRAKPASK
ncbi:ABC transporter substrate-binding protein [Oryzicola mucosus]|uniref:ABC transporter substrate-binding protein n=1 Tax=Oryzicola mucosus TaxID=2767425 RepID=A0A8J6PX94_9HYPH|nr:ABC transporter substrate-binding protein [Oryzicola mucosus]MBD0416896.1 ABC transporter substrate-binding protein [Oryzicola mucosus]